MAELEMESFPPGVTRRKKIQASAFCRVTTSGGTGPMVDVETPRPNLRPVSALREAADVIAEAILAFYLREALRDPCRAAREERRAS